MTAYCSAASLATFLQRALTAAETASAAAVCAAASDYIDHYLGRSWQAATVTDEVQTVERRDVFLDVYPVVSVTSVTGRAPFVGDPPVTLTADVDYEMIDPSAGRLLVSVALGTVLTVTYTVDSMVPGDIAQAANIIAASYLIATPAASLKTRGIQKLKAGSAEITYDPIDASVPLPPAAMTLLAAYRPVVVFA